MLAGLGSCFLPDRQAAIRWQGIAGRGPRIVWLPGISFGAVPSFLATATAPPLTGRAAQFVDYLGAGESDWPKVGQTDLDAHVRAVAKAIEAAGDGPVNVVGHSMGGTVAIALAEARPDLVGGLVLGEPNVHPGGGAHSRRIVAEDKADFVASGFEVALERLEGKARAGDPIADYNLAQWRHADPGALHDNARMLVDLAPDFHATLLSLDCPRTFIFGARTYPGLGAPVTPDAPDPAPLEAAGITVEVLEDAGHMLMLENPEGFAAVVARALD